MSPDQLEFEAYRLFRSRVVEEDGLINHRMNWLLWTSAILLAFWGATVVGALKRDEIPDILVKGVLLGGGIIVTLAGEIVAISSLFSVAAARKEVERIRDDYYQYIGNKNALLSIFQSVTGETRKHLDGHRSAKIIPWIFICIWPFLIGASIYAFDYLIHDVSSSSLRAGMPPTRG